MIDCGFNSEVGTTVGSRVGLDDGSSVGIPVGFIVEGNNVGELVTNVPETVIRHFDVEAHHRKCIRIRIRIIKSIL